MASSETVLGFQSDRWYGDRSRVEQRKLWWLITTRSSDRNRPLPLADNLAPTKPLTIPPVGGFVRPDLRGSLDIRTGSCIVICMRTDRFAASIEGTAHVALYPSTPAAGLCPTWKQNQEGSPS